MHAPCACDAEEAKPLTKSTHAGDGSAETRGSFAAILAQPEHAGSAIATNQKAGSEYGQRILINAQEVLPGSQSTHCGQSCASSQPQPQPLLNAAVFTGQT